MNTLSHIGFPEKDEMEVNTFLHDHTSFLTSIHTPSGTYIQYSDPSGGEIFFQKSSEGLLLGYSIHYTGKTSIRVSIVKKIDRKESMLDAALLAWAAPKTPGNPESGIAPLVFDVPDFYAVDPMPHFPLDTQVQLAAYPVKPPVVFHSVEEYHAFMEGTSKISSISFIPSGLLIKSSEFEPSALITGVVDQHQLLTNNVTGGLFYHLVLQTSIGMIDVVTHPSFLDKNIGPGMLLSGEFYLSGKILLSS